MTKKYFELDRDFIETFEAITVSKPNIDSKNSQNDIRKSSLSINIDILKVSETSKNIPRRNLKLNLEKVKTV